MLSAADCINKAHEMEVTLFHCTDAMARQGFLDLVIECPTVAALA